MGLLGRNVRHVVDEISRWQWFVLTMITLAPITGQELVDWYLNQSNVTLLLVGLLMGGGYLVRQYWKYTNLPVRLTVTSDIDFKPAGFGEDNEVGSHTFWFATVPLDDLSLSRSHASVRIRYKLYLQDSAGDWHGPFVEDLYSNNKVDTLSRPNTDWLWNYIEGPTNLGGGEASGIEGVLAFNLGVREQEPSYFRRDRARLELYETGSGRRQIFEIPDQ